MLDQGRQSIPLRKKNSTYWNHKQEGQKVVDVRDKKLFRRLCLVVNF